MNPQRKKTLLGRPDSPETATGKLARRYDEKIDGNVKSATVGLCMMIIAVISTGLAIWLKANVWLIAGCILWVSASWAMWRNRLFAARQWANMAEDSTWWVAATKIDDSASR